MTNTDQIKMWDKVHILTTRGITWVSPHPDGTNPSPQGVWDVAGILGSDLLVSKRGAMCRVPIQDAQKVLKEQ